MTQPNSVNMTFDTSLIDLNGSFSTTESGPSDTGTPATPQQPPTTEEPSQETPKPTQTTPTDLQSSSVKYIGTQAAYDQWASVYDTDGNMLQSIDSAELATLLPSFLSRVASQTPPISLIELGCGTGRNTSTLLTYPWPTPTKQSLSITALDFSASMLGLAATKLMPLAASNGITLHLSQADCFPSSSTPAASPIPALPSAANPPFSAALSTLVLEHVSLPSFFATLSALLAPGAHALVTNMHAEMGARSQAGFVGADGVKVRGESFVYGVEEIVREAERCGFCVLEVREREVQEEDLEAGVVGARGRKWVGCKVWAGFVFRKREE